MKRTLILIPFLALLVGCGALIPQQRTENASIKTTEAISAAHDQAIEKIIEGEKAPVPVVTPPPNITVSGTSNSVAVNIGVSAGDWQGPVHPGVLNDDGARTWTSRPVYRASTKIDSTSTQGGNSAEEATSLMKKKIPLWVALIGGGIGILILVFAIRYALTALKSSAAGAAALSAADNGMAGVVKMLESHASSSTDPNHTSMLQTIAKELESARGKAAKLSP